MQFIEGKFGVELFVVCCGVVALLLQRCRQDHVYFTESSPAEKDRPGRPEVLSPHWPTGGCASSCRVTVKLRLSLGRPNATGKQHLSREDNRRLTGLPLTVKRQSCNAIGALRGVERKLSHSFEQFRTV